MRRSWPDARAALVGLLAVVAGLPQAPVAAQVPPDMIGTKHDLSISGPGPVRALTEDRICVFCHTPHNAAPLSPLWNRDIPEQTYIVYTSPTMLADPLPQPFGPTKLCLTCHDGTVAMGAVLDPSGGIPMAGSGTLPPGSLSDFGFDLSAHHPVAFPYGNSLPNPELASPPPEGLTYGGIDEVHCITCHDPHNDQYGRFLAKDNRNSALCVTCHQIPGWAASLHATSTASVVGLLPRPPKTWPNYTELGEWGCEACHTPHFAPTAVHLLNFTALPPDPFDCTTAGCHGGGPPPPPPHLVESGGAVWPALAAHASAAGGTDIERQVRKVSAHRPLPRTDRSGAREADARLSGRRDQVACSDCHNPHEMTRRDAVAPYASGLLTGVSGVDRNGAALARATYAYEVCLKCHGDDAPGVEFVPRYLPSLDARRDFDPSNPSFHPVMAAGRNRDVPSIPSSLAPIRSVTDLVYCTDCHADDEGASAGPHGSAFAPILKERYDTADGTLESYESYALCYRCHERTSLLADQSFRRKIGGRTTASGGGHSGHLAAGIPCAACHDAHGVSTVGAGAESGSHTHLINFDRRLVSPLQPGTLPTFRDTGTFSGSCSLVCHGVAHDEAAYP